MTPPAALPRAPSPRDSVRRTVATLLALLAVAAAIACTAAGAVVLLRRSPPSPEDGDAGDVPRGRGAARHGGGDASEPAALEFPVARRDLGRLDAGAPARVEFPWRRRGPGEVRVLAVETGCSCAVVSGLPEAIPPGATGTLALDVRGRTRPGPFTLVVRLVTDPSPDDVVRLTVLGFVGSAVLVDPLALDLGGVRAGLEVTRFVTVRPPPSVGDLRVEARLADVAGRCDVLPPARRGVRGTDVRVVVRVPDRLGPFHGHVEVRVPGEGLWRVAVRGVALCAVEVRGVEGRGVEALGDPGAPEASRAGPAATPADAPAAHGVAR